MHIDFPRLIRGYASHTGISVSYASRQLTGSGDTITRIESGGSLTMRRAQRILQTASDVWPLTLPWPADIHRPHPTPGSAACPADARAALEAVRAARAGVGPAAMREDWAAAEACDREAFRLAATLGADGQVLSPAALCEALSVPRHTYDDVVHRYGAGGTRCGCAPRDRKSDVGRTLALLRGSGDVRFAPPSQG